jgi:hypothetical protein
MPILGSFLLLALEFREALGSRESIHTTGRHHRCSGTEVSLLTLCPLG